MCRCLCVNSPAITQATGGGEVQAMNITIVADLTLDAARKY